MPKWIFGFELKSVTKLYKITVTLLSCNFNGGFTLYNSSHNSSQAIDMYLELQVNKQSLFLNIDLVSRDCNKCVLSFIQLE